MELKYEELFEITGKPLETKVPEYGTLGDVPDSREWKDNLGSSLESLALSFEPKPFQTNAAAGAYHGKDVLLAR